MHKVSTLSTDSRKELIIRGVPTERLFYVIGPSIAIKNNNPKQSHSGNSSPVRFRVIFDVKKTPEVTCDGFRSMSKMSCRYSPCNGHIFKKYRTLGMLFLLLSSYEISDLALVFC